MFKKTMLLLTVICTGLVFFSSSAIAAYSTCHRIEHLFFIPIISLATSMVTLIGMFYGAKKFNLSTDAVTTGFLACL